MTRFDRNLSVPILLMMTAIFAVVACFGYSRWLILTVPPDGTTAAVVKPLHQDTPGCIHALMQSDRAGVARACRQCAPTRLVQPCQDAPCVQQDESGVFMVHSSCQRTITVAASVHM